MPQLEHDQDIMVVCNIDTGCDFEDEEEGISHHDSFMVRYGGIPFEIAPGDTRRMARYLARHYAKHLADHMLLKNGKKVNDMKERPRILSQIVRSVDTYYLPTMTDSEVQKMKRDFDELNEQEDVSTEKVQVLSSIEVKDVIDPMMGKLEESRPSLEEVMKVSDEQEVASLVDPSKPLPTKKEMLEMAHKMELPVTGKETQEQLASMLKGF